MTEKAKQITQVLATYKKGTNVWITYKKELGNGVFKTTTILVRLGIEYSHIQGVVAKGKGSGEHLNEYIKVFANGNECLMAYKPSLGKVEPQVVYTYNGKEITKDQAMLIVDNNKVFKSSGKSVVYCFSINNIVAIGNTLIA